MHTLGTLNNHMKEGPCFVSSPKVYGIELCCAGARRFLIARHDQHMIMWLQGCVTVVTHDRTEDYVVQYTRAVSLACCFGASDRVEGVCGRS